MRDGEYVAVGAVEPVFFERLVKTLGVDVDPADQLDRMQWPAIGDRLAAAFATRTREEWAAVFAEVDACVTPVLTLAEAESDPHLAARKSLFRRDDVLQPAASPRFSVTRAEPGPPPRRPGSDTAEALVDWGIEASVVDDLLRDRVVVRASP